MPNTNNPVVASLATYPGTYQAALFRRFYNAMDFVNDVTVIPNVKYKLNLTKLSVSGSARPYTGTFVAENGDLNYTPKVLSVDRAQRDIEIHPDKYRSQFLGEFMDAGSDSGNKSIPFAQYTWETIMGEQAASFNDRLAWAGVGTAAFTTFATGDTASAGDLISWNDGTRLNYYKVLANVSSNQTPVTHPAKFQNYNVEAITIGWKKRIADAISGSEYTVTTTGSVDSTNGYSAAIAVFRALPAAIQSAGAVLFCSYTDYYAIIDHYESSVGKYTMADAKIQYLPKTMNKCVLKACTWITSRRIFATPKENILYGTDRLSDMNTITTIPQHYTVEAGMTSLHGFQIRDFSAFASNDQA